MKYQCAHRWAFTDLHIQADGFEIGGGRLLDDLANGRIVGRVVLQP